MYRCVYVITTKDKSGGMYDSYSTGGQGFMAVSKQTSSSSYTLRLCLFTPWHCAVTTKFQQLVPSVDSQ